MNRFIKANNLSFPIVFDRDGDIMKAYNVMTIPSTFFINEKGELEKSVVGPITVEQMKEWAEKKAENFFRLFYDLMQMIINIKKKL